MRKGIIVASFGTSFPEVRKRCIESIEMTVSSSYPEYEVKRTFTSNMIIKKLKERDGILIDTPSEAIEKMINKGVKEIHVQPLHIIPGFEYEKVMRAVKKYNHREDTNVTIGLPLLSKETHYDELIEILNNRIGQSSDGHGFVFMGHGTEHHANACYSMLQAKFNDVRKDVHIANVEGYPELDHIVDRLREYKSVTLLPLMIVAGDHAMNDMAGDDDDSYKSILEKENIKVNCILEGLGEYESIGQVFLNRINQMID